MLSNAHVPIIGFAAWSGTGKTTLLKRVLPCLKARGLRVGVVKHAHHNFDVDHPGKDSYELRKSGADQMLIASRARWALMVEQPRASEPRLDEVLLEIDQAALDLILVEGFKQERFAKIELHRPSLRHPLLFPSDDSIVAVASDAPLATPTALPTLDLNDADGIAEFIVRHTGAKGARVASGGAGQSLPRGGAGRG
ncbi:MAG: molybdopterin-guanine dinucleotide biosynthesis protein MobB [Gammaproteobacteria bacterium]|nr:molybdopterin-guanine dinucleotide biosynthesis protein MobB [Gammaproteobacteria bacterium]